MRAPVDWDQQLGETRARADAAFRKTVQLSDAG